MSQILLQEARSIGEQLSATEKAQLIEWLSIQLRQELDAEHEASELDAQNENSPTVNGHSHTVNQHADLSTEEGPDPWTDEEIRALMKPEPKTGAEIVALLQQVDLSSWQEQDIPDVVEWLQNRREQSRRLRQAQWNTLKP